MRRQFTRQGFKRLYSVEAQIIISAAKSSGGNFWMQCVCRGKHVPG